MKVAPFEALGDLIKVLDKVAKDGSSRGRLRFRGELDRDGEGSGKWGIVGRAQVSEDLAVLAKLPAELGGGLTIEKVREWLRTSSSSLELEWDFGPEGTTPNFRVER